MFRTGDKVNYGVNGVCIVDGIRKETIGRETHEYYVLKPLLHSRSTVCVPVDNDALVSRMIPMISEDELEQLIPGLGEARMEWIENDLERLNEFRRILRTDDRRSIFSVIRLIREREDELLKQNRHLKNSDLQILKTAEAVLFQEFSMVLSIEPEEVYSYVTARIRKNDSENGI